MSTKPKTIAAAEKRQIKAELAALRKSRRKILADCRAEAKRIASERRALDRRQARLTNNYKRETAAASRRIAILEGRL